MLYFTYSARRSLRTDWQNFVVRFRLVDVINCAKFYRNRLRGLDSVRVKVWPFPLYTACDVITMLLGDIGREAGSTSPPCTDDKWPCVKSDFCSAVLRGVVTEHQ